ncbi:hypothetical protein HPP92_011890 [Vanilla planifolia]|uniref:Uncharacterized protein n=1 Tax=Vanilla planifolia TaxID=51239 RepID=A0A835R7X9_VANPL|nr:hypothetical protein HPP92_011890 [Vanilla planifolia]
MRLALTSFSPTPRPKPCIVHSHQIPSTPPRVQPLTLPEMNWQALHQPAVLITD